MIRPGLLGVALASAALAPLPAAASQLGDVRLSVARSAEALSCPDDEVLAARVRALRQGKEEAPALLIDVLIERDLAGYRATIRVNGPRSGVRELRAEGDACGGLSDALAVSLALLLDEEIQASQPPGPPVLPGPPEPPASWPPEPRQPSPAARSSLRLPVEIGAAHGLPGGGLAPALAVGLRLALPGPLRVGLLAAWTPGVDRSFAGGQVVVGLQRAELEGCLRLVEQRRLEASGCALASAGLLTGEGQGFSPDRSVERPFLAVGAGPQLRGPLLPWVGWVARGALLVPLLRERFVVDQQGVAYALPAIGFSASVGLELRLW